jgi:hypothetical protein
MDPSTSNKTGASNVPPKMMSAAVATKVVGPKKSASAAKPAKKSATRKDPPAVVAELPTNPPEHTLANVARYIFGFSLLLSLACRCCRRRSLRRATTLSSFSLSLSRACPSIFLTVGVVIGVVVGGILSLELLFLSLVPLDYSCIEELSLLPVVVNIVEANYCSILYT